MKLDVRCSLHQSNLNSSVALTGFDIAILVISMPVWFSGTIFGICAVIRHDLPNVPIIVVGPNNVEAKIRLFEIGANDVANPQWKHKLRES